MKKFAFAAAAIVAAFPLFAASKPDAEAKKLLQKFAEREKLFNRRAAGPLSLPVDSSSTV